MNRRRAPSKAGKKPSQKKPIERKADKPSSTKKRPRRKNAPVKSTGRRRAERGTASASTRKKKAARPSRGKSTAQNRRRPAQKPAKAPKPKRSLRERAQVAQQAVGGWVVEHHGGLRRAAQAAGGLLALAALWWVGQQTVAYARTAEAFAIRDIAIEGNVHLKDIDVRRAARLQIGSNIFEVSVEDARNSLLQHPWVRDADVVRRLPGRVRIEIRERNPVALVALDQLYLVSDEGAVFKRLGVDDPVDLPVITGIASERFYDDLDYRTEVLLGSMALLQDYEGAGLAAREPVSEIHFDGANGIELFIGPDGMNVRLGSGQHRQKLRRLRSVLDRLAREKTRPSYVYLDNVRSPERVTARLP